jgi:hypothetical protein
MNKKTYTRKIVSTKKIAIRYVGSIGVKMIYSSTHKSMAEATKKGNKLLVESIEQINATSLILEEK